MNRLKKEKETKKLAEKKPKKKSKLKKGMIFILVIAIMVFAIKTALSIYRWQQMALSMMQNQASQVLDVEGNVIAELGSERNRQNVSFSQMPDNLKNAYVAIEDERFYRHFGIDLKRTAAAIGSYIIHFGNASFGASTITQQLVKNITGDDANSITRKVKEWTKAIELEWCMDKDEILESYLNIIYVGPNIYGVEKGANYYFSKSVTELDLVECAFLAGINNAPNAYNPFKEETDNAEKIKKRTKTVLKKMLELENITKEEYDIAIAKVEAGIQFKKGKMEPEGNGIYSYHTDALLSEVISDLAEEKKISKTFATNYLYMANAKIQSTQNSKIQEEMETEFVKKQYLLKSSDGQNTSQAAMIVMDHKTGQVLGCVGGLGQKQEARGFNRATQAIRQTGSSSKPIAVIIPVLAEKIATPVTTYIDEQTRFIDYNNEEYSPINYNNYLGEITLRRAVESSQNIPFVKMMEQLTPGVSIKYLEKMGISTLNEKDENLALALGGLDKGISPLEMAGAYSTIANDGVYIEPTFYTKITDNNGKEVLQSKQVSRRVFSEEVAYVTKQLLTQPVVGKNGTATYCTISGMDVAAKTGTTNEDYDRWLCGFTNYYTAVAWFGFDLSEPIRYNSRNPAGMIWADVMKQIHKDLENSKFKEVKNVVSLKICQKSLKVANSGCTDVFTEYFVSSNLPEVCDMHQGTVLEQVVNEEAKQKIKDVVKSTVETIREERTGVPEQVPIENLTSIPVQTPVEVPTQETPESIPETMPNENLNVLPEENNNSKEEDENEENQNVSTDLEENQPEVSEEATNESQNEVQDQ